MAPDAWPEVSEFELNSWALLTAPDISMRSQSFSSVTNVSPSTDFYDTTLIPSNSGMAFAQDHGNIIPSNSPSPSTTSIPIASSSSLPRPQPSERKPNKSPSATSPSSSSSPPSLSRSDSASKIQKRTLNTLAARRYRQRRVDQMASLEAALKQSEKEKEELAMRVARLEGEVEVLRGLLKQ